MKNYLIVTWFFQAGKQHAGNNDGIENGRNGELPENEHNNAEQLENPTDAKDTDINIIPDEQDTAQPRVIRFLNPDGSIYESEMLDDVMGDNTVQENVPLIQWRSRALLMK